MLPYSIPPGIPLLDVERLFRGITVCLRDGNFAPVLELESTIATSRGLRNTQSTQYVWSAKGDGILSKIKRMLETL
jgi:hypothetical protein